VIQFTRWLGIAAMS